MFLHKIKYSDIKILEINLRYRESRLKFVFTLNYMKVHVLVNNSSYLSFLFSHGSINLYENNDLL